MSDCKLSIFGLAHRQTSSSALSKKTEASYMLGNFDVTVVPSRILDAIIDECHNIVFEYQDIKVVAFKRIVTVPTNADGVYVRATFLGKNTRANAKNSHVMIEYDDVCSPESIDNLNDIVIKFALEELGAEFS